MLMRVLMVLAGYVSACVAFASVLALFVFTPWELVTSSDVSARFAMAAIQAALSATQVVIFAAAPALVAAIVAEWRRIGEWTYYTLIAILIAVAGLMAQYASEPQGAPTIGNNYAATAFLAGGLVAGLIYWIVAGRHVGARRTASSPADKNGDASPPSTPARGNI